VVQIYFHKKNFDTQKAERWFRERRVPIQLIDLTRARIGRRELEAVRAQVGLDAMIDKESMAWKECPARFAAGEDAILGALLDDPRRLKLPIVRNGRLATVGYQPDTWAAWENP
jgi:arsenate reductase-like glutaredoxin family protein